MVEVVLPSFGGMHCKSDGLHANTSSGVRITILACVLVLVMTLKLIFNYLVIDTSHLIITRHKGKAISI